MPVTIVVGGQFGSEGKGKVALQLARESTARVTAVRVGGPNSGHTGYDSHGNRHALRQLPASCIDREINVVFPAGSYLDVELLLSEIDELDYPRHLIHVSPNAMIVLPEHKDWEREAGLVGAIGSTGSGTGGAVFASAARGNLSIGLASPRAACVPELKEFICDSTGFMRARLDLDERVIIEGTQGFGLSLHDSGFWPKVTARITSAAGALAEAGLAPHDVDDITMVIRSYPIRVAGESGPLTGETDWSSIAAAGGRDDDISEFTTVTKKLRRVGTFDAGIVRSALAANHPSRLVMNHLDYIGPEEDLSDPDSSLSVFLSRVEKDIGRRIDWMGFDGMGCVNRPANGDSTWGHPPN